MLFLGLGDDVHEHLLGHQERLVVGPVARSAGRRRGVELRLTAADLGRVAALGLSEVEEPGEIFQSLSIAKPTMHTHANIQNIYIYIYVYYIYNNVII